MQINVHVTDNIETTLAAVALIKAAPHWCVFFLLAKYQQQQWRTI